jgi:hypothetical protein
MHMLVGTMPQPVHQVHIDRSVKGVFPLSFTGVGIKDLPSNALIQATVWSQSPLKFVCVEAPGLVYALEMEEVAGVPTSVVRRLIQLSVAIVFVEVVSADIESVAKRNWCSLGVLTKGGPRIAAVSVGIDRRV